jgi:hypothetical protein
MFYFNLILETIQYHSKWWYKLFTLYIFFTLRMIDTYSRLLGKFHNLEGERERYIYHTFRDGSQSYMWQMTTQSRTLFNIMICAVV